MRKRRERREGKRWNLQANRRREEKEVVGRNRFPTPVSRQHLIARQMSFQDMDSDAESQSYPTRARATVRRWPIMDLSLWRTGLFGMETLETQRRCRPIDGLGFVTEPLRIGEVGARSHAFSQIDSSIVRHNGILQELRKVHFESRITNAGIVDLTDAAW